MYLCETDFGLLQYVSVQPFALGKEGVCCVDFYISPLVVQWRSVAFKEYYALFIIFVVTSDLKLILKLYSLA